MTSQLRCQVYPGQFSTEYAVVVQAFNGRSYSLFASAEDLRLDREPTDNTPGIGWLWVTVLRREGNHVLVQLPQATIENGTFLSVTRDQLKAGAELASA